MREAAGHSGAKDGQAEIERELTRWRKTHHAPTPLPDHIWKRAADLGAQLGVTVVARSLRLNRVVSASVLGLRTPPLK
mgnify:CR=1 FL=1